MSRARGLIAVVALAALAAVSAAIAFALPSANGGASTTTVVGPGMMGGYGGMMGGYGAANADTPASAGSLRTVRSQVESWLTRRSRPKNRMNRAVACAPSSTLRPSN